MASAYGTFEYNWKHDVSIRSIKMVDIGYLFAAASIVGYIVARFLSRLFPFDEKNYSDDLIGIAKLIVEIILEMALIGICIYASRQLVQALPFPFDGWKGFGYPEGFTGFKHKKLREWENPYPIAFFIVFYQDALKAKIVHLTKLTGW